MIGSRNDGLCRDPHPQRMTSPLTGLRLLLPALLPSWRFFDAVTASPRVDYALLADPDDEADHWQEFRPRPAILTPGAMFRRLLWNAEWNENLFLVSLAERLMRAETAETVAHSQRELQHRVARHLDRHDRRDRDLYLQIRIRLVGRVDRWVADEIVYLSGPRQLVGLITP